MNIYNEFKIEEIEEELNQQIDFFEELDLKNQDFDESDSEPEIGLVSKEQKEKIMEGITLKPRKNLI